MKIRQATVEDLDVVTALFEAYREFYRRAPDSQAAREFLGSRLQEKDSVIFLAMDGPKAIGFAQLYPSFSSLWMRRIWVLNDLFVSPEARGRAVGREIVLECQKFAKGTGAKGLTLKTATDNLKAQKLYESLGWLRETDFCSYDLNLD